jgi:hypothetical protein
MHLKHDDIQPADINFQQDKQLKMTRVKKPTVKTAAQLAYEADLVRQPDYFFGRPRPAWETTSAQFKRSWARRWNAANKRVQA